MCKDKNQPSKKFDAFTSDKSICEKAQQWCLHMYKSGDNRGVNMTFNGVTLWSVIPNPSLMSMVSSSPIVKSNWWRRRAIAKCIICCAKRTPGHILLPDPNGMNSKFSPLKSISRPSPTRNLSGRNSNGSSHTRGSWWIFHKFTNNRLPAGTW